MSLILEAGADINKKNKCDWTPLELLEKISNNKYVQNKNAILSMAKHKEEQYL